MIRQPIPTTLFVGGTKCNTVPVIAGFYAAIGSRGVKVVGVPLLGGKKS